VSGMVGTWDLALTGDLGALALFAGATDLALLQFGVALVPPEGAWELTRPRASGDL
jgi:hypothetical protein